MVIFALKPAKPVGNCSNDGDDNEWNEPTLFLVPSNCSKRQVTFLYYAWFVCLIINSFSTGKVDVDSHWLDESLHYLCLICHSVWFLLCFSSPSLLFGEVVSCSFLFTFIFFFSFRFFFFFFYNAIACFPFVLISAQRNGLLDLLC